MFAIQLWIFLSDTVRGETWSLTEILWWIRHQLRFVCLQSSVVNKLTLVLVIAAYLPSWSPAARTRTRCPSWSPLAPSSAWSRSSRGCCPLGPPASSTRSPCCLRRRQPATQHRGKAARSLAPSSSLSWHARARTGTHADTPLSFQIYRLRFTPPRLISSMPVRERQREPRREDLKTWSKSWRQLPARLSSRGRGGAGGRTSCQQKRKVSIRIKLDAGKFNFRSTFRINFNIRLYRCREMGF